jgi:GT2 family glycosyltransferase
MVKASIIIPSYNGRQLLEQYLPGVVEAVSKAGGSHQIVVVEDGGSDNTCEWLESDFQSVTALKLQANLGFQRACNAGAGVCDGDVLVFLNNDMAVDVNFLEPLLAPFSDESVFAVCAKSLGDRGNGIGNESPTYARWHRGELCFSYPAYDLPNPPPDVPGPIAYAFGGAVAVSAEKFDAIGGFDDLYAPWTVEDVDLSYRAWKRGWKVMYEPGSVVYHRHSATISQYGIRYRRQILARNFLLLTWKNITSRRLIFQHLMWLPVWQMVHLLHGRRVYAMGLVRALPRLPAALAKRRAELADQVRSDEEVLDAIGGTSTSLD